MTPDEAIRIVARQVLVNAMTETEWEGCPDIGEHDWDQVTLAANDLVKMPSLDEWTTAYELLAARASHDGDM